MPFKAMSFEPSFYLPRRLGKTETGGAATGSIVGKAEITLKNISISFNLFFPFDQLALIASASRSGAHFLGHCTC